MIAALIVAAAMFVVGVSLWLFWPQALKRARATNLTRLPNPRIGGPRWEVDVHYSDGTIVKFRSQYGVDWHSEGGAELPFGMWMTLHSQIEGKELFDKK